MDEELDIVVTGFDVSDRQAEAGLQRVFGVDAPHARRFVRALPVTAKRCANKATADRYAAALRSIGARLEIRTVAESAAAPPRTLSSLPIPAPSILAHVEESQRVERETERAIARFRAREGLDASQPTPEVDPVNPRIPKAPPLPHDLAQMPNASLPRFERPDWMLEDPLSQTATQAVASLPHFDADPPPRPSSSAPRARSSRPPASAAATPLPLEYVPHASAPPPPATVGLAHGASASVRPGLGILASWRPGSGGPSSLPPALRRYALPAALLALLLCAALAWIFLSGSDTAQREQAFRAQGIDPGEFAPAAWFDADGHGLRGMERPELKDLLGKLTRAGVLGLYALRIAPVEGGQRAEALLVELPPDPEARRSILWHIAQARGAPEALIPDSGHPYYVLEFKSDAP